jgi:hypothetical protein
VAFGFRRVTHSRIRALLYAGRPNWELLRTITPRMKSPMRLVTRIRVRPRKPVHRPRQHPKYTRVGVLRQGPLVC